MWGICGENVDFSQQIPHIFSVQQLNTSTEKVMEEGTFVKRAAYAICKDQNPVQVNDGWLDMDTKSNVCPDFVHSLSSLRPITESVQWLFKPGPNSVKPLLISKEHGQRLDFKIQGMSRYCHTGC